MFDHCVDSTALHHSQFLAQLWYSPMTFLPSVPSVSLYISLSVCLRPTTSHPTHPLVPPSLPFIPMQTWLKPTETTLNVIFHLKMARLPWSENHFFLYCHCYFFILDWIERCVYYWTDLQKGAYGKCVLKAYNPTNASWQNSLLSSSSHLPKHSISIPAWL